MKLRTGLKVQLTEPAVIVSTIKGYPDDCAEIQITYTNKYGEEHKQKNIDTSKCFDFSKEKNNMMTHVRTCVVFSFLIFLTYVYITLYTIL